jgi:hypothetical protein
MLINQGMLKSDQNVLIPQTTVGNNLNGTVSGKGDLTEEGMRNL